MTLLDLPLFKAIQMEVRVIALVRKIYMYITCMKTHQNVAIESPDIYTIQDIQSTWPVSKMHQSCPYTCDLQLTSLALCVYVCVYSTQPLSSKDST